MKIVIHCYNYTSNTESIGLNVNRYANELTKNGHEVTIITKKNSDDVDFETNQKGIQIYRIPRGDIPVWSTLNYMYKVTQLIKYIKPDIVHEHEASGVGYIAKKHYKIPYIVYGRGIDIYNYTRFTKKVIRKADHIVALSVHMQKFIEKNIKPNCKISIIRNGIREGEFDISKKNNPMRILYVGRLIPTKNVDKLILAMKHVIEEYPEARLTIAGDGYQTCKLFDIVSENKLSDCVNLIGKVDRDYVKKLYEHAGIFVMPTEHTEGCNNTIIEAMLSGCAVICTPHYGNDELISDNDNGILLESVNPEHIAEKIKEVIESNKIANFQYTNQIILDNLHNYGFNLKLNVKKLEQVYEEVING